MLKWLVAAMGALLIGAGGYTAVEGWGIVQVERGWAQVIAGSALMTGGFVILAIAALIARIDAVFASIAPARLGQTEPGSMAETVQSVAPQSVDSAGPAENVPEPPAPIEIPLPSAPRSRPDLRPIGVDLDLPDLPLPSFPRSSGARPSADPASLPPRADLPGEKLQREAFRPPEHIPIPRFQSRNPRPLPKPRLPSASENQMEPESALEAGRSPPPRLTGLRAGAWPDFPEGIAVSEPRPSLAKDPLPLEASPPALVRRYESGGVSYQLFSDGSIEAQTEGGLYKFSSLEELRTFIESKKI